MLYINKNKLKILLVVFLMTTVPEVVRSTAEMVTCNEANCGEPVDADTFKCRNGHSSIQQTDACSHGRIGPCINCDSNEVKKCRYGHLMLVNDPRCGTCDSIFRSQLLSNANASLDSGIQSAQHTLPSHSTSVPLDLAGSMWTTKSNFIQPPTFPTAKEQYKSYLADLVRWQRCTSIPKERQADVIMINVPQTHRLKERLEQEIGAKPNEGLDAIKSVLKSMYGEDDVFESFLAFKELEQKQRKTGQCIIEYTLEWECVYNKAKLNGALKEDQMKAFQYLATANCHSQT